MKKTNLILSERSKVRLTADEMFQLREYIKDQPTAYGDIKRNTQIDRRTVIAALENGYTQLKVLTKLRKFLSELSKLIA